MGQPLHLMEQVSLPCSNLLKDTRLTHPRPPSVELHTGIMAGSLPALKPMFKVVPDSSNNNDSTIKSSDSSKMDKYNVQISATRVSGGSGIVMILLTAIIMCLKGLVFLDGMNSPRGIIHTDDGSVCAHGLGEERKGKGAGWWGCRAIVSER